MSTDHGKPPDLIISYFILSFSLFLVSDHGKIIKAVNAESADSIKKVSSVVIEELDVLPTSEPIRNLEIIRTMQYGKLKKKRRGKIETGKCRTLFNSERNTLSQPESELRSVCPSKK